MKLCDRFILCLLLQSLANQIGINVPRDDPLAALEVIEKRCRDLSANQHLTPTSTTDPTTAPHQQGTPVSPPVTPPPRDSTPTPPSPLPEWLNAGRSR